MNFCWMFLSKKVNRKFGAVFIIGKTRFIVDRVYASAILTSLKALNGFPKLVYSRLASF